MTSPLASRRALVLALGLAGSLVLAACGGRQPTPDEMAADAAALQALVPVVEALQVTDFEQSPWCRNLGYARGAFGDLTQDGCERDGTVAFDALALDDHRRVSDAIAASGVPIDRILSVTYDDDGRLETAWFHHAGDELPDRWEYLYDPTGVVPKAPEAGRREFARAGAAWWFVRSEDD